MEKTRHIETRYALREATERLVVAYWSDTNPDFHVRQARGYICDALCGGDFEILVECIEETIRKNPDGPAHAVAMALLDYAAPLKN